MAQRYLLQAQRLSLLKKRKEILKIQERHFRPSDIPTLQDTLLRREQILLSYFIDTPPTPINIPHPVLSCVFLLTPDTLLATFLTTDNQQIRHTLQAVSPFLSATPPRQLDLSSISFDMTAAYMLYKALLHPVATFIPAHTSLLILPDGALGSLPFAMLPLNPPEHPYQYEHTRYLIEEHPIAYELSALLPLEQSVTFSDSLDLLALGRSTFSPETLPPALHTYRLSPLPQVKLEIELISKPFKRILYALNKQATEPFFFTHAPRSRIIHLASHTLINNDFPLQTFTVLFPDSTAPLHFHRDGLLHIYELQHQLLNPDLVVLSSCNTARGFLNRGEGFLGMHYAFRFFLGSCYSLWPYNPYSCRREHFLLVAVRCAQFCKYRFYLKHHPEKELTTKRIYRSAP